MHFFIDLLGGEDRYKRLVGAELTFKKKRKKEIICSRNKSNDTVVTANNVLISFLSLRTARWCWKGVPQYILTTTAEWEAEVIKRQEDNKEKNALKIKQASPPPLKERQWTKQLQQPPQRFTYWWDDAWLNEGWRSWSPIKQKKGLTLRQRQRISPKQIKYWLRKAISWSSIRRNTFRNHSNERTAQIAQQTRLQLPGWSPGTSYACAVLALWGKQWLKGIYCYCSSELGTKQGGPHNSSR